MTKSTLRSAMAACLALALTPAAPAAAALSCTASVSGVAFGSITVRDGSNDQTTGTVEYSCSGGTPNAAIAVCLTLGAGTGGAEGGNSPRYMRRGDNTPLSYELRSVSQSGRTWDTVVTGTTLDGNGAANFQDTIFAVVTSTGSDVKGGSYSSTFTGGDATFRYGEVSGQDDCTLSGTSPTFNVTATVAPACTIDVAPLSFGSMESLAEAVDAQTTITANCTNATSYSISLGLGNGNGVTGPAARKMTKGGDTITYGLYQNPDRTTVWGDQVSNDFDGAGTGSFQSISVYGRIPSQNTPPTGTYTDTVVVTITY
ncbi:MAG: spore coat U domain-containing protein [Aestuariivirga sp.]|nr:spore coat U domain-containing protein [Aestuariivirga sp.]